MNLPQPPAVFIVSINTPLKYSRGRNLPFVDSGRSVGRVGATMKKRTRLGAVGLGSKDTLVAIHRRNLAERRIRPEHQRAEYRPKDFPDEFPPEADEKLLKATVWWWRFRTNVDQAKRIFPPETATDNSRTKRMLDKLNNLHEPSAWFYEFRARYADRYQWDFGCPWISCTDEQHKTLSSMIPAEEPAQVAVSLSKPGDSWITLDMFWVNLRLNDEVLARQFFDHVAEARRVRGVKAPGPGRGVRRRPLSWAPLESMDIRHHGIRALTDGERSQLSKARRRYVTLCKRLGLEP